MALALLTRASRWTLFQRTHPPNRKLLTALSEMAPELRKRSRADDAAEKPNVKNKYQLTRRVVAQHSAPNDAWVVVRGVVYDITPFLSSHPGGADVIYEVLGGDASAAMDGGSHSHSAYAYKLLEKYRIGELVDSEKDETKISTTNTTEEEIYQVDWSKPILPQIGEMGSAYDAWIHSFPTTDHTVKMFQNDIVESLTKCAWYVPLLFWTPIIVYEVFRYINLMGGVENIPPLTTLVASVVGGVSWLFFEYALHRYIFHIPTSSYTGNIIHFLIHGHHHITPMDFDRLVFPPVPAMILAAPFYFGAPRLLGDTLGYPWMIGFVIGYLVYDMTHFFIHHHVPKNSFMRAQKRRHVFHHYFDPDVNFGISNPLFDYVFRTVKEPASS